MVAEVPVGVAVLARSARSPEQVSVKSRGPISRQESAVSGGNRCLRKPVRGVGCYRVWGPSIQKVDLNCGIYPAVD